MTTPAVKLGFLTTPDGRRLFCPDGVWSRPYVVPDGEVEQRIVRRAQRVVWPYFGLLLIVLSILWAAEVGWSWMLVYLAGTAVGLRLLRSALLRPELSALTRLDARLPLGWFYRERARLTAASSLVLGLACNLLLASWFAREIPTEQGHFEVGEFGLALCALGAVTYASQIALKISGRGSSVTEWPAGRNWWCGQCGFQAAPAEPQCPRCGSER